MTVLPKDVITISHISRLELAIKDFSNQEGRLPANLTEVVSADFVPGHICKDGWGALFNYEIPSGNIVTLVSYCGQATLAAESSIEAKISNVFDASPSLISNGTSTENVQSTYPIDDEESYK